MVIALEIRMFADVRLVVDSQGATGSRHSTCLSHQHSFLILFLAFILFLFLPAWAQYHAAPSLRLSHQSMSLCACALKMSNV